MNTVKWGAPLAAMLVSLLGVCGASAQTTPDAGSLIRDISGSTQPSRLPDTVPPVILPGEDAPQDKTIKLRVKDFRIVQATLFTEAELKALLADLIGKELSLAQLQQAALRIGDYYRQRGYFARALLPRQVVEDGVVEIRVLESTLGGVEIAPPLPSRAQAEVARQTVLAQQKIGEPLRPDDILRGLKLLNETPGYGVKATLKPGAKEKETNLVINLEDTPLVNGAVMADNRSSRGTGAEQVVGTVNINNPSGRGDQIGLVGLASQGSRFMRAAYTVGLGYSGLRIGANTAGLRYKLVGSLASLNAEGKATIYGVTATYPLLKTQSLNLYGNASSDVKHFVNDIAGANSSNKTLRTVGLSLTGDVLDDWGGRGLNQFSFNWVTGNADLSANAADMASDLTLSRTHGTYQKASFSLARLQKLTDKLGLFVNYSGQLANRNLDSSEKFSLGGGNGIRAYPLGEASGDQGWMLISELRYNLDDNLQLVGFVDTGSVTQHKYRWSGWNATNPDQSNVYNLMGAGMGLNWTGKDKLMLRSSLAGRLGSNPGRDATTGSDSDGTKRNLRVWVQLIQPF